MWHPQVTISPWRGTANGDTMEVVSTTTERGAERQGREWTVSVNATGLRVEEVGGGKQTVVSSNALFMNRALFQVPVAVLSDDYRCIRYDHRGQGDSGLGAPQPAPGLLGTVGLYDDAVALLDELGVLRFAPSERGALYPRRCSICARLPRACW